MVRVYLSRFLRSLEEGDELKAVSEGFKFYKSTNNPGAMFGRDAPLDRPSCARASGLQHVHLLDQRDLAGFDRIKCVSIRDQYRSTSDSFVIYCQGFNDPNSYLLLDVIWFDAHEVTRDYLRVIEYADEAERFYKSGK